MDRLSSLFHVLLCIDPLDSLIKYFDYKHNQKQGYKYDQDEKKFRFGISHC
jgi:hypothetical protein